jgi:hypothetical protein
MNLKIFIIDFVYLNIVVCIVGIVGIVGKFVA